MIELPYSLVIEATEEPDFFTYFSPDLPGFSGVGHSVEECIDQSRYAMLEHTAVLSETNRPVPPCVQNPIITVQNAQSLEQAA
jgi:predicted RNase H-like HicB family nuclease